MLTTIFSGLDGQMPDHVHRSADRRAASEVDGVVCAIGSYNLDRRSLLLNWELSVLVGDETTARTLDRNFDADLDRCIAIDRTSRARRGILQRLFERLFYTFQDSPARWVLADSATVGHGGDADRVLARDRPSRRVPHLDDNVFPDTIMQSRRPLAFRLPPCTPPSCPSTASA